MRPVTLRYHSSSIFTLLHSTRVLRLGLFCATFLLTTLYTISQNEILQQNQRICKIRNISYYLQRADYYLHDNSSCKANTELVIGVISSPPNYEARRAIRISWGKQIPPNWHIVFIIGKNSSEFKARANEQKVIEVNIIDSYQNLTIKVGLLFNWVLRNCHKVKYLLKVDDDVYLNINNIRKLIDTFDRLNLKKFPSSIQSITSWNESGNYVALGYVYKNVKPDRNPSSKWYLRHSIYRNQTLPDFLSGTAYLFSTNLLPYILKEANSIPLLNLEDVYFTGLVMTNRMKLVLQHSNGWSNFRPRWDDPCYFRMLLTAHGMKPQELVEVTNVVNDIDEYVCNSTFRNMIIKINSFLTYYFPVVS